ncbi:MAG: peptide chain release factor N(5)-glutamine methyltransferase [Terracidiphilus sp.]
MTLREWLRKGEADLSAGPHPDRARRDAESLLLHLIGKNRAWLLTHLGEDFGGCKAISYAALLQRRLAGEPIQYISGECEFHGLLFRVTPAVLIPRPETEHLVEIALGLAARIAAPRILDMGTGSGAIAISLAHNWSEASITATDLSSSALDIARANAKRLGFAEQIRFVQGDLLAPVAGETFDLIVSNPPYVPEADRASLSVEVRDHEPAQALFAGPDGLEVYRRLIPAAFAALAPGGYLALEIGFGQPAAIADLLESAGFSSTSFTPDLQNIPRVVTAQRV